MGFELGPRSSLVAHYLLEKNKAFSVSRNPNTEVRTMVSPYYLLMTRNDLKIKDDKRVEDQANNRLKLNNHLCSILSVQGVVWIKNAQNVCAFKTANQKKRTSATRQSRGLTQNRFS